MQTVGLPALTQEEYCQVQCACYADCWQVPPVVECQARPSPIYASDVYSDSNNYAKDAVKERVFGKIVLKDSEDYFMILSILKIQPHTHTSNYEKEKRKLQI